MTYGFYEYLISPIFLISTGDFPMTVLFISPSLPLMHRKQQRSYTIMQLDDLKGTNTDKEGISTIFKNFTF